MRMMEATGGDPIALRLRRGAHADAHATVARLDRPGAIAAKFAAAGDALVLPDLLQNIADRPLAEVRPWGSAARRSSRAPASQCWVKNKAQQPPCTVHMH